MWAGNSKNRSNKEHHLSDTITTHNLSQQISSLRHILVYYVLYIYIIVIKTFLHKNLNPEAKCVIKI